MQYRQEVSLVISSPILLQGIAKTQKYIQEISKLLHFSIRYYVMPPPGGVIKKFYVCAQLHSF